MLLSNPGRFIVFSLFMLCLFLFVAGASNHAPSVDCFKGRCGKDADTRSSKEWPTMRVNGSVFVSARVQE